MIVMFDNWIVPAAFQSDGCTIPFGLRTFAKWILDSDKATPACRLHDFLRRHAVWHGLPVSTADAIFRRALKYYGLKSWQATLYWLFVKLTRPWFSATYKMPPEWQRMNAANMERYGLRATT